MSAETGSLAAAHAPSVAAAAAAGAPPPAEGCVLCRYTGSTENAAVAEVFAFISESAGKIAVREIASQARCALNDELQLALTDEDVERHILAHSLDQRVVLSAILRDLVDLASNVKHASVVQDAETGACAVDTKALMAYLKTVAEITNIYKMESMRSLK